MASTVRAEVDVKDLYDDLVAAGQGLDKQLTGELERGARDIADASRKFMREGEGVGRFKGSTGAELPHIRDSYTSTARGLVANVISTHPAGPVWEFGGTIAPHSPKQVIRIPHLAPVHLAALEELDLIALHLQAAVDRLLATFRL